MQTDFLRVADTILAVFWVVALVVSLKAGRIGGSHGFQSSRVERPGQYWFFIAIMTVMIFHFGGLAIVGQKPLG